MHVACALLHAYARPLYTCTSLNACSMCSSTCAPQHVHLSMRTSARAPRHVHLGMCVHPNMHPRLAASLDACACVHLHVYMCICTQGCHKHMNICVYIYICVCVYVQTYVYICTGMLITSTHTNMNKCIHMTYVPARVCVPVCLYVCQTCRYVCAYVYLLMYTRRVYICPCTYVCMYLYRSTRRCNVNVHNK